jgi:hypothetical protein
MVRLWRPVVTGEKWVATKWQGLTLVPNSAQLEIFCPPYNPT